MTYLMESPREGERLARKTDLVRVRAELIKTGFASGMRALDAGCASGAVTGVMAELAGPAGRVSGIDLSHARLAEAATAVKGATWAKADLGALPFADETFDYVLCRLVLEYIREPTRLVRELARVTQPGGRLVLVDVDGYGAFHHPLTEERQTSVVAIGRLLEEAGFDPFVGRKLFSFLRQAGLVEIAIEVQSYHVIAGDVEASALENWRYKLETLAPFGRKRLGPDYDRHARVILDLYRDPDVFSYSTLMIAFARRP